MLRSSLLLLLLLVVALLRIQSDLLLLLPLVQRLFVLCDFETLDLIQAVLLLFLLFFWPMR